MKQVINSTIQDIRGILLILFTLIILGGFFGAVKEHTDQNAREALNIIEKNAVTGLEIILWGIGIAGTIGTIIVIVTLIKQNDFF